MDYFYNFPNTYSMEIPTQSVRLWLTETTENKAMGEERLVYLYYFICPARFHMW